MNWAMEIVNAFASVSSAPSANVQITQFQCSECGDPVVVAVKLIDGTIICANCAYAIGQLVGRMGD